MKSNTLRCCRSQPCLVQIVKSWTRFGIQWRSTTELDPSAQCSAGCSNSVVLMRFFGKVREQRTASRRHGSKCFPLSNSHISPEQAPRARGRNVPASSGESSAAQRLVQLVSSCLHSVMSRPKEGDASKNVFVLQACIFFRTSAVTVGTGVLSPRGLHTLPCRSRLPKKGLLIRLFPLSAAALKHFPKTDGPLTCTAFNTFLELKYEQSALAIGFFLCQSLDISMLDSAIC